MTTQDKSKARKWVGQPLPRLEDARLLRGAGCFTDDVNIAGQAWCVFVRSPHAHAEIRAIDASGALAMPGVFAVLTGADYLAAGHAGIPQGVVSAGAVDFQNPAFKSSLGHTIYDRPHMPIAVDRARYNGEIVALVIAQTEEKARLAAENVRAHSAASLDRCAGKHRARRHRAPARRQCG